MAKQPPPLTLIERLQEAQKRSTYWRDGYAPLLADVIEALIDTDHAVALEREAIAAWLERKADALERSGAYWDEAEAQRYDAQAIRDGAHHANTPPNAQERG